MIVHSPVYSNAIYDPTVFPMTVRKCCNALKAIYDDVGGFDCIAGIGNSSLPLLGAIAFKTGLPYIAVRKAHDVNHDERECNGMFLDGKATLRYVFVDDLISSGETYWRVRNVIATEYSAGVACVGALLYAMDMHTDRKGTEELLIRDCNGHLIPTYKDFQYKKVSVPVYDAFLFDSKNRKWYKE